MCAYPFSREKLQLREPSRNFALSRPLLTRAYWSGSRCTHLFSSILDSTHDVLIACAAADIALETFAYLVFSRVRVVLEQLIRGHNHPRRAEATLQTVFLPEAFLDRVQAALGGQSLNCGHFTAISLHRQHRARLDGIAIEQYCARPALRSITADVG